MHPLKDQKTTGCDIYKPDIAKLDTAKPETAMPVIQGKIL